MATAIADVRKQEDEIKERIRKNWKLPNRSPQFPDELNDQYLDETKAARKQRTGALTDRVRKKVEK